MSPLAAAATPRAPWLLAGLSGTARWHATTCRSSGELVESAEGFVDLDLPGAITVRAQYDARPCFLTTIQVGEVEWTRAGRELRGARKWVREPVTGERTGPVPHRPDLHAVAAACGPAVVEALGLRG